MNGQFNTSLNSKYLYDHCAFTAIDAECGTCS